VNINQPLNKSEATTNAFTTKKVKYYNLSYSTTNLLSLMPFHKGWSIYTCQQISGLSQKCQI